MDSTNVKLDANKSFGIYHDLNINAPIEKVYAAISDPEHLINWWPLKCQGNPELDSAYNFYFAPEYDWYGKVNKLIPNQSFYIKMTTSDSDWNPTTFGFDLKQDKKGVKLSFSHSGWLKCNTHFRVTSFCWAMLLKGLNEYLEKGTIVPFEERG